MDSDFAAKVEALQLLEDVPPNERTQETWQAIVKSRANARVSNRVPVHADHAIDILTEASGDPHLFAVNHATEAQKVRARATLESLLAQRPGAACLHFAKGLFLRAYGAPAQPPMPDANGAGPSNSNPVPPVSQAAQALPHFEAVVLAEPNNAEYHEALVACLEATGGPAQRIALVRARAEKLRTDEAAL